MGKGHFPKGRGHVYSWQRGWHAAGVVRGPGDWRECWRREIGPSLEMIPRTPGYQSGPGRRGKKMSAPFLLSHPSPQDLPPPPPPPASATLEKHEWARGGELAQRARSSCLTLGRACSTAPLIPSSIKWNCSSAWQSCWRGESTQALLQGGSR